MQSPFEEFVVVDRLRMAWYTPRRDVDRAVEDED
jgi:hypothetical protein